MGHRTPQEHLWFHQGQWSQRSRGSGPPHLKELLLSLPWCLKYFEVIESLILKQVLSGTQKNFNIQELSHHYNVLIRD
jgi:hypothetical protein